MVVPRNFRNFLDNSQSILEKMDNENKPTLLAITTDFVDVKQGSAQQDKNFMVKLYLFVNNN